MGEQSDGKMQKNQGRQQLNYATTLCERQAMEARLMVQAQHQPTHEHHLQNQICPSTKTKMQKFESQWLRAVRLMLW